LNLMPVYKWLKNNHSFHCLLCLSRGKHGSAGICEGCLADLPWYASRCRQCALPMPIADSRCGRCQRDSPAFAQVVTPFLYRFPVDSLVLAFKYHHQLTYGKLLGLMLLDAVRFHYQEHHQTLPDCLVPMPLHRSRQAKRGYNQALELARPLLKPLAIPLELNNLIRERATQAQQGLDAQARRQNLQGAFRCRFPERIRNRHVALVDDVMTTGTTADEASRTLLDAGAASVSIWCVARTP